jgi:TonB family protein
MRAAVSSGKIVDFGSQWLGQTVDGRFPLLQYLGSSGESAVFLTQLLDREKTRAVIKLVRPNAGDAKAQIGRWRRASELSHPHLIGIFECGRCWLSGSELLYVVHEYADETLAQVLPHRALTTAEADAMLRPAVQALDYLHGRGLVHGHIQPSNVMAVNDRLKLSSDGIQTAGSASGRSEADLYAAPEVEAGQVSPAADVWSLGLTLVESLTQNAPQKGSNVDYSKLAPPFAEIVRHALARNPAARWTVRDIAAAIHLELPDRKREEKPGFAAPSAPPARPKRRLVPVLALPAMVLVALAAVVIVRFLHPGAGPARPTEPGPEAAAKSTLNSAAPSAPGPTGAVLHRVLPEPSASASRTIHGRIKVRLRVKADASGNVADATLVSPGPSKYFARLAMQAAQQWKFAPATVNGQPSASEWNLLFEFTRSGVEAFPQQENPSP